MHVRRAGAEEAAIRQFASVLCVGLPVGSWPRVSQSPCGRASSAAEVFGLFFFVCQRRVTWSLTASRCNWPLRIIFAGSTLSNNAVAMIVAQPC